MMLIQFHLICSLNRSLLLGMQSLSTLKTCYFTSFYVSYSTNETLAVSLFNSYLFTEEEDGSKDYLLASKDDNLLK